MPYTFHIDKSLQTIFTKIQGVITLKDVRNCVRDQMEDPDFHSNLNQLTDFGETTELKVTSADIQSRISATPDYIGEESRRAVVIPNQPAMWAILKMYQTLLGLEHKSIQKNFQVFEDMDAAKKWLGLN